MTPLRRSGAVRGVVDRLRHVLGRRSDRLESSIDLADLPLDREGPEASPLIARIQARLSKLLIQLHDPVDAVRLAHAQVRRSPRAADSWDSLADGVAAMRNKTDAAGSAVGPCVETDARRIAFALRPTVGRRVALGESLRRDGDLDAAERDLQLAARQNRSADAWYRLGRLHAERAVRSGGYTQDAFEAHHESMQAALRLDPTHDHARHHLLRVAFRNSRWDLAFGDVLARHDADPFLATATDALLSATPSAEIDRALAALDSSSVPSEWWLTAHWRLMQLGMFTSSYDVKDRYARSLGADRCGPAATAHPSVQDARLHIQIASCLGEPERGLDAADYWSRRRQPGTVEQTLRRLTHDLRLEMADTSEWHRSYAADRSDRRFHELIRNSSVAIVGPAESHGRHGAEIDAHDVVIRTKYTSETRLDHEQQGSRTDIAYFADRAFALLWPSIERTLDTAQLSMAVVRRSAATTFHVGPGGHPKVRVLPSEIGTLLEASQLAVQRILYDLVAGRPSRVDVYNVDLYTTPVPYVAGYHIDEAPLRMQSVEPNLEGYGHDLRADHRFASAARTSGFMSPHGRFGDILDLDSDQYLQRVEAARLVS